MNLAEHTIFHQILDRSLANSSRVLSFDAEHEIIWQMRDGSYVLEQGWLDVNDYGKVVFYYSYFSATELQWENADHTTDNVEFYGFEVDDEDSLDEQYLDEEYYT